MIQNQEREYFEKNKKQLELIGEIITVFNRIENIVVASISDIFVSSFGGHERMFLINDVLNDGDIFERFEQKIDFLKRVIKRISRIAIERKEKFEEEKYLKICASIKEIQKYRNKIAHMSLAISPEGKAMIFKRKTDK